MNGNKRLTLGTCVLAVTLIATGCTSMRAVAPLDVRVGTRIRVLDSAGQSTELRVTAIGAEYVEGRTKDGAVRVALVDVREVRERRFAPGKTVALGLGVLYVVAAAVTVAAWSSLAGGI